MEPSLGSSKTLGTILIVYRNKLENIKNNFGLDDFRVILDETTTTPEMIDRNTIYAKIFLKPTKAVEFFAIDFVITNSGAGFED